MAKLPNAELAVIDPRKLKEYVLSTGHPSGRFKAAYCGNLGFTSANWRSLALEIRRLAREEDAELDERNAYGQKYVVRGNVTSPSSRTAEIVTVWIILDGEHLPRFVTLFPEG